MSSNRIITTAIKQMREAVTKKGGFGYKTWKISDTPKRPGPLVFSPDFVTYFSSIDENDVIRHDSNQACHADLGCYGGSKYIISRLQWGDKWDEKIAPKQVVIDFLEWLTKKSPYAKVFIYGGGERTFKRGFLIARTDVPANLLAGAMFAHRAVTEHSSYIMKNWHQMYKRGVNPNVAFCYAHGFADGAEGLKTQSPIYDNWHIAIPTYTDRAFIFNFRDGEMINPTRNYRENGRYFPVHGLWGDNSNARYLADKITAIHNDLTKAKMSDGPINPFAAGARMKNVVDADEFYDIFCPILIKEFGE